MGLLLPSLQVCAWARGELCIILLPCSCSYLRIQIQFFFAMASSFCFSLGFSTADSCRFDLGAWCLCGMEGLWRARCLLRSDLLFLIDLFSSFCMVHWLSPRWVASFLGHVLSWLWLHSLVVAVCLEFDVCSDRSPFMLCAHGFLFLFRYEGVAWALRSSFDRAMLLRAPINTLRSFMWACSSLISLLLVGKGFRWCCGHLVHLWGIHTSLTWSVWSPGFFCGIRSSGVSSAAGLREVSWTASASLWVYFPAL